MKKVLVTIVTLLIFNFSYAQSPAFVLSVGANSDIGYNSISAGFASSKGLTLTAGVFNQNTNNKSALGSSDRKGGLLSFGYSSVNAKGVYVSSDFYISNKFHHGMTIGYKVNWFAPAITLDTFSGLGLKAVIILR